MNSSFVPLGGLTEHLINLNQAALILNNKSIPLAQISDHLMEHKVFRFGILKQLYPEAKYLEERNLLKAYFEMREGECLQFKFIEDIQSKNLVDACQAIKRFRGYLEEGIGFSFGYFQYACLIHIKPVTIRIKTRFINRARVSISLNNERHNFSLICKMEDIRKFQAEIEKMISMYSSISSETKSFDLVNSVKEALVQGKLSKATKWAERIVESDIKFVEKKYRRSADRKLRTLARKGENVDEFKKRLHLAVRNLAENIIMNRAPI